MGPDEHEDDDEGARGTARALHVHLREGSTGRQACVTVAYSAQGPQTQYVRTLGPRPVRRQSHKIFRRLPAHREPLLTWRDLGLRRQDEVQEVEALLPHLLRALVNAPGDPQGRVDHRGDGPLIEQPVEALQRLIRRLLGARLVKLPKGVVNSSFYPDSVNEQTL